MYHFCIFYMTSEKHRTVSSLLQSLLSNRKFRFPKEPNMSTNISSVQFSSVAQLCPTLCNPMDCSTPGFPVHHQLPELAQTHVHQVSDATQPSSVVPFFFCFQSFPASGSSPLNQFFASGDQSIGASATVFPVNIHD